MCWPFMEVLSPVHPLSRSTSDYDGNTKHKYTYICMQNGLSNDCGSFPLVLHAVLAATQHFCDSAEKQRSHAFRGTWVWLRDVSQLHSFLR